MSVSMAWISREGGWVAQELPPAKLNGFWAAPLVIIRWKARGHGPQRARMVLTQWLIGTKGVIVKSQRWFSGSWNRDCGDKV
jgi:hypothetical protein